MAMDPLEFLFMEDFFFPDESAETGQQRVECPSCGTPFELTVDPENTDDRYQCHECSSVFTVNWVERTVASCE
jgi:DNA-directed RNA polymerase subunit RPC12/RpoP